MNVQASAAVDVLFLGAALAIALAVFILSSELFEVLRRSRRAARVNVEQFGADRSASADLGQVPILSGVIGERGIAQRSLREAGLQLSPVRYALGVLLAACATGSVIWFTVGDVLGVGASVLVVIAASIFFVRRRVAARQAQLTRQLVDLVDLLASSLRGGFGFVQAIEVASREIGAPMSELLADMLQDIELGASIEDALGQLSGRLDVREMRLLIQAVLVQRRVGGDLGEVLTRIGGTLRERAALQREVTTLTAQTRGSAWVIGALPVVLLVALSLIQPAQMSVLVTTFSGRLMLLGAALLEIVGFFAVQRAATVKF